MSTVTENTLVQVEFDYEYTRDARLVSIKQNEQYILVSKTNDSWWYVKKDDQSKPFYVPAQYVREVSTGEPASPGVQSLNGSDSPESQNKGEVMDTSKKQCDVEKNQLVHQQQGQNVCSSDLILEKKKQTNSSPTKDKDPSLNLVGSNSPPTMHGSADSSQGSSVAPDLLPCYSEVHRAITNSKESDNQNFTSAKDLTWQSSTIRVQSKQQANHTQRFSLVGGFSTVHLAPQSLERLYMGKDISPSEMATPPRSASFSHVISPKRQSSAGIGAMTLGRPIAAEKKDPANSKSFPQTSDCDCENVYESIPDLPKPKSKARKGKANDSPKEFEEKPGLVYQNVTELRQQLAEEPSSFSNNSTNQLEEWEMHTDQATGQPFYYNVVTEETTWDSPFDSSDKKEPQSPHSRTSSTSSPFVGWESHLDEVSGQPYYYNPVTGETTWDPPDQQEEETTDLMDNQRPPTPEEDYPEFIEGSPPGHSGHQRRPSLWSQDGYSEPQSLIDSPLYQPIGPQTPPGWSCEMDQDGQLLYTSEVTQEKWIRHVDSNGKFYYYNPEGTKSEWELPQYGTPSNRLSGGNGVDQEGNFVFSNWRHGNTLKPVLSVRLDTEEKASFATHRRNASDFSAELALGNRVEILLPHSQSLDKAGILNKAKVADNGKRIRKNWASSWTVLQGGILTFYKDPKNQSAGSLKQAVGQFVPEYTVELKRASIGWATRDKSSKKNVLELKTRRGSEYLIQYDTESVIGDWYKMINESIHQQLDSVSVDEVDAVSDLAGPEKYNSKEKDEKRNRSTHRNSVVNTADAADHKKVKTKLKKFLLRRPTLQSVREKGYIQDQVFGCVLEDLCQRENNTVPNFVVKCIQAVEKRGLDIDGLYRVSGNLAIIQKLRFTVNHDENVKLEEGPWDDVHVITGALKLFFRELPEPLFPFSYFENFISAMKLGDPGQRLTYMQQLIRSLPVPNHDTMQVLFKHLCNVIECRNQNRMSSQSMAIVFGPTLLKSETETGNIAVHMVYQNQIVEFILNQYQHLFDESRELAVIR
ncbi:rho GTPase-activating protein 27-like isoform X1 [Carcharodon carcharias]|uniref:rho GTPase-activating protein 27-like isoform X1 n=2 Tax=Carcharodon carcharias TaxID=13397 RepID=UPI001B7EE5C7|nr:rho GTPase-activating protein 27-like isoform X1 [Carcharodon carcharias]XP_041029391.1 rho GTPase-activating protein 27-like isoform X1 [Carcharodon carcharias]